MWIVSEEEVFSAIRYLDPDLPDGSKLDEYQAILRFRRRLKLGLLVVFVVIFLCITIAKLFPVSVRLLESILTR